MINTHWGGVVENNLFTGDPSGGLFGGHKTWNTGLWMNGGGGRVSGNTFELVRTAMNADDFNAGMVITGNKFRLCGSYLAIGGTNPVSGTYSVSGNDFDFDFTVSPGANPTLFNLSNVASTFRLNATGNTFDGVATTGPAGSLAPDSVTATTVKEYSTPLRSPVTRAPEAGAATSSTHAAASVDSTRTA